MTKVTQPVAGESGVQSRSPSQAHALSCLLRRDGCRVQPPHPCAAPAVQPVCELHFPQYSQCPLDKGMEGSQTRSYSFKFRKKGITVCTRCLPSCSSLRREIREEDALPASSIACQEREKKPASSCCLSVTQTGPCSVLGDNLAKRVCSLQPQLF